MNNTLNPLEWNGPQFLVLYALLLGLGGLIFASLKRRLHDSAMVDGPRLRLTAYQLAMLEGGPSRVIMALLASFYERGMIDCDPRTSTVGLIGEVTSATGPLEAAAIRELTHTRMVPRRLQTELSGRMAILKAELESLGCMVPDGDPRGMPSWFKLAAFLLFGFGVAKMVIGLSRDKPVLFLFILLCFSLALWICALMTKTNRTPFGNAVLNDAKQSYSRIRLCLANDPKVAADNSIVLPSLVALYGLSEMQTLGMGELAPLVRPLERPRAGSTGGDGGSSCSSCGSGDGGGDGGGCGGGGCGGCGGGGD